MALRFGARERTAVGCDGACETGRCAAFFFGALLPAIIRSYGFIVRVRYHAAETNCAYKEDEYD